MAASEPRPDLDLILSKVVMYKDHPVPGHRFADIFPVFRSPAATRALVDGLVSHVRAAHGPQGDDVSTEIHAVVCLEARGWFFGPLVAAALGLPCVPVRKRGKLPGRCVSAAYRKDYGEDVLEMTEDSFEGIVEVGGSGQGEEEGEEGKKKVRVLVVDDLIAFGGTAEAAKRLVEMLGGEVAECLFVFEIPRLRERVREKMGETRTWSLIPLTEDVLSRLN
ncbi:putative adenine phosphoribosyltransferase [Xylariomycetidae sp. FL2044]|nr:putative adenine phosphoribosyltransferase [Xylariomycetidae sp. FL2044]